LEESFFETTLYFMKIDRFKTRGGTEIEVREIPLAVESALAPLYSEIDSAKGALFSSGFDYPGRHSRWDIGFIDPALEFVSRGRKFSFTALSESGVILLDSIQPVLSAHAHVEQCKRVPNELTGTLASPPTFFTEEERSRQPSIFSVLRTVVEHFQSDHPAAEHLGFYGAFGYDLVLEFEKIELKHPRDPQAKDCQLFLPLEVIVVDRKRETASRFEFSVPAGRGTSTSVPPARVPFPPGSGTSEIVSDHRPGEFAAKVKQVIDGTAAGDYFEVVLSQSFSTRVDEKPTALFRRLGSINPSPYMFLLNFGDEQLVGASPELFVRVTAKRYETCPIAGTVARGASALEDAAQVQRLLGSRKEESELTMCTDVDRNDMARVCVPGTVRVIGRRQLEFYSHLIHTVDHVEGFLRDEFDALDAFQTHMWACTVTGAPKPAALQEIENLECSPRGWYSGAIGILNFKGNINTGITLRTAHIKAGRATIRAGATLLFDSDPELEELETRTKAAAFLSAITEPAREKFAAPEPLANNSEIKLNKARRILLVDYKDSFVHNLAAYLRELGAEVVTVRCGFPLEKIEEIKPDLVLLSPGPGTPEEFGVPDFVGYLASKKLPTFGVCLGHQGIGQHFGATVGRLPLPEHGKASRVFHQGSPLFRNVEQEFEAGRYHSLYLLSSTVPDCLEVTAYTLRPNPSGPDEVIPMAVRHRNLPIAGVQFHPESLMTLKRQAGHHILKNAIETLTP